MERGKLALGTLVVALVLAASPAWAALVKAADWQMDETSGQMTDSSGNANHGNPTDVVRTGSAYVFDGSTSRVAVPDNDGLDPAGKDITLRASVAVPDGAMADDSYDVVRKGLSTTAGGDYKMEIKRASDPTVGNLNCVFKGDVGTVNRLANVDVVDGNRHTLECAKTSNSVVARVDGVSYAKAGTAGSIANDKETLIGAKTTDPFDDVFEGSMDSVGVDIDATATEPPADTTAPAVQPPEQNLLDSSTLGTSAVPVKIGWAAADDSGISGYELQQSVNDGAYAGVKLATATATSKSLSLAPANAYQYRVRATDGAANTSDWSYGPRFVVDARQEGDAEVSYGGAWTPQGVSSAYGGALKYATGAGSNATFGFTTGMDVAWVASRGPDRGKAEVWVDGAKVKTVDLYASAAQPRKAVYTQSWDEPGSHTLEVRVLGTKRSSSSGTRVDVDAFVVLR